MKNISPRAHFQNFTVIAHKTEISYWINQILFSKVSVHCKGIRIPDSAKFLLLQSTIQKNVARRIRNPMFQNPDQSSRNQESHFLTIVIRNQSSTDKDQNPGSVIPYMGRNFSFADISLQFSWLNSTQNQTAQYDLLKRALCLIFFSINRPQGILFYFALSSLPVDHYTF